MRSLVQSQAISEAEIPANDPGKASEIATAAIVTLHRAGLSSRFVRELLNAVEPLGRIAEVYGVDGLAFLFDLQAAILNDTFVEAFGTDDTKVLELIERLPSGPVWMKHVRKTGNKIADVNLEKYIKVSADSIGELRKVDVFSRVAAAKHCHPIHGTRQRPITPARH
jgi:hypothetical protein